MPFAPAALPQCKSFSMALSSCKLKGGTRPKQSESLVFFWKKRPKQSESFTLASVAVSWPMAHIKMLPNGPRVAVSIPQIEAMSAESKRPKSWNSARICETRAFLLLRMFCRKCFRINLDKFALSERSCAALRRCRRSWRTSSCHTGLRFGIFNVVFLWRTDCCRTSSTPCIVVGFFTPSSSCKISW